jgi:hypothetical protein
MANDDLQKAITIGLKNAETVLARRATARANRAAALAGHPAKLLMGVAPTAAAPPPTARETAGFLVAMGDSWFDYPLWDVVKLLEDNHGYDIESAAHRGDPIESMAYQGGQLDKLARCFEKLTERGATPKAVLVSGGGDDIAGEEFGMLLNSAASGIPGWNNEIVDGVINQRILAAYRTTVQGINALSTKYVGKVIPILVHGYDYPVPDGRGFLGGWGPLPGPWLQPGFRQKLFEDLAPNVVMMHDIIDRFNVMLKTFASDANFSNVRTVDLRGALSSDLAGDDYKNWWGNELHPTDKGFGAVADKFAAMLTALP